MQRSLFWCFHLSNWLDLLYGPYSLVENYYYDFFQEFEDNQTSIDRDRTLLPLIDCISVKFYSFGDFYNLLGPWEYFT